MQVPQTQTLALSGRRSSAVARPKNVTLFSTREYEMKQSQALYITCVISRPLPSRHRQKQVSEAPTFQVQVQVWSDVPQRFQHQSPEDMAHCCVRFHHENDQQSDNPEAGGSGGLQTASVLVQCVRHDKILKIQTWKGKQMKKLVFVFSLKTRLSPILAASANNNTKQNYKRT